jgi:hypothetical protein
MAAYQRSDQQRGGRFVQGGKVDIKGNRLGWWERVVFPKSPTDISYTVTAKYAQRPDLLAFDLYGRATLQWFIMQYNTVSDVYEDFTEGTVITLPTRSRLFGELLSKST